MSLPGRTWLRLSDPSSAAQPTQGTVMGDFPHMHSNSQCGQELLVPWQEAVISHATVQGNCQGGLTSKYHHSQLGKSGLCLQRIRVQGREELKP